MIRVGFFVLFIFCGLLNLSPSLGASENYWDHSVAQRINGEYRENQDRLEAIASELKTLAAPYRGGPTGTVGYLSKWQTSPEQENFINFKWNHPIKVNAVSLLPLRLYLGSQGKLTENAYWPGSIRIDGLKNGQWITLAYVKGSQQTIRRSLPEWIEFEPHEVKELRVICRDLTSETSVARYAAGFAEILIFSGKENMALKAKITCSGCREDRRSFSHLFLTDEQTPLGFPEKRSPDVKALGVYRPLPKRIPEEPLVLEIHFDEVIETDAVRIYPAIIHKPGQCFPVRFEVQVLGLKGRVIRRSKIYGYKALINPGVNPYTAYFDRVKAHSIRLIIYEASRTISSANPIVQLSEVIPLDKGVPVVRAASFQSSMKINSRISQKFDTEGKALYWTLESLHDGMTHSGKVMAHFDWALDLSKRQELLTEQHLLRVKQASTLRRTQTGTLTLAVLLILLIICLTIYTVRRLRSRNQKEIQEARESITSDLHDETGSSLSVIALRAEEMRDQSKDMEDWSSLNAIVRLSKESIFGLREVIHSATPNIGRAQSIASYMDEIAGLTLVKINYKFDQTHFKNSQEGLGPQFRRNLLLFYRETLNNCQRHSQAAEVDIWISNDEETLTLNFKDNGVGMTLAQLAEPYALRTLKQRAERLHGNLEIVSEAGEGLQLTLKAPLSVK